MVNPSQPDFDEDTVSAIMHNSLSKVWQWIVDDTVTEIMINPGGHVFIESKGEMVDQGVLVKDADIESMLKATASRVLQDCINNDRSSIVNASINLPPELTGNGKSVMLRVSGGTGTVCPKGSFLTIRRHMDPKNRPSLEKLIELSALTQKQADVILDTVIDHKMNCIFAGGTGSGKTTLINAVLAKLPTYERVISVEDAQELEIKIPNAFPMITNPSIGITAKLAIQTLLRQRPDRIILGETRGDETFDLIRAMNSGHPGSMTSIHANGALDALASLEMLFQMSIPQNASISAESARQFIARAIHLVVFVGRHVEEQDGRYVVRRGVEEMLLVRGLDRNGHFMFDDITDMEMAEIKNLLEKRCLH